MAVICLSFTLPGGDLRAQTPTELKAVLDRLDRLERENQSLREEIHALRSEVTELRSAGGSGERATIQERRIEELAQTKVEASERFPIRLTGMALFNAFSNTRNAAGLDFPLAASAQPGDSTGGATLRQTTVGLQYSGPTTAWGGKIHGDLNLDFYGGTSQVLNHLLRIRTASIGIDWKTRAVTAGLEKPLFAPRSPNSLAWVGVPALSGAGNLWLWQPQARFEQRFAISDRTGLSAQAGVVQATETAYVSTYTAPGNNSPGIYSAPAGEQRRPGVQGRFPFFHESEHGRRIEIAPGFHFSSSHVIGKSVPSNLFSLDWFFRPWSRLEFTGAFFSGQNVAPFGSPNAGFNVLRYGRVDPVHSRGGWGQLSLFATSRLSFSIYGGQHDDRNADLLYGQIGNNRGLAANAMYRFAPNVVVGLEALQLQTTYLGLGRRLSNHYDLAVAYLF